MKLETLCPGPILERKGMHSIFQKKGKKGQNILKFRQKCTKFESTLRCLIEGGGEGLEKFKKPNRRGGWKIIHNVINGGLGV